jgi:hypothetical protein
MGILTFAALLVKMAVSVWMHDVVCAEYALHRTVNNRMVKNFLNFRDRWQQIVAQIPGFLKHCVQLLANILMEARREIGLDLDIAVDDEIPHLFIGESQCWFIHLARPPLFLVTGSQIPLAI